MDTSYIFIPWFFMNKKIAYLLFSFIDLKENNEMNANKRNRKMG